MGKKNTDSKSSHTPKEKDGRNDPSELQGWPGYRTREGRSGLDPIDSRAEAGHTLGTIIQYLFTGRLRIKNPVILFITGILGLVFILPLVLAVIETINGILFPWSAWITFLVAGGIGMALLVNFVKNLDRRKN